MRNYIFIAVASLLLAFNLYHLDFENPFNDDSKIALAGILACLIAIVLILILDKSQKINNNLD